MSKILAEAVSELRKERTDATEILEQQTPSEEECYSEDRGRTLPETRPSIESL